MPGESDVSDASRKQSGRDLGSRSSATLDCVTIKFTSATTMAEVLSNVLEGIYMSHVAMGLKEALAFRVVVEVVKVVPQERVHQLTFVHTADVPVQRVVDRRALPSRLVVPHELLAKRVTVQTMIAPVPPVMEEIVKVVNFHAQQTRAPHRPHHK